LETRIMGISAEAGCKTHEMCEDVAKVMRRRNSLNILREFGYRRNRTKTSMKYWLENGIYANIDLTSPIDVQTIESDVFNYIYIFYVVQPKKMQALRSNETKLKNRLLKASIVDTHNTENEMSSLHEEESEMPNPESEDESGSISL